MTAPQRHDSHFVRQVRGCAIVLMVGLLILLALAAGATKLLRWW